MDRRQFTLGLVSAAALTPAQDALGLSNAPPARSASCGTSMPGSTGRGPASRAFTSPGGSSRRRPATTRRSSMPGQEDQPAHRHVQGLGQAARRRMHPVHRRNFLPLRQEELCRKLRDHRGQLRPGQQDREGPDRVLADCRARRGHAPRPGRPDSASPLTASGAGESEAACGLALKRRREPVRP
jgi:hypothetical protein